jgi:hypothetical protein
MPLHHLVLWISKICPEVHRYPVDQLFIASPTISTVMAVVTFTMTTASLVLTRL